LSYWLIIFLQDMKWNGPLVPLAPRLERETRDRGNN